MVIGFVFLVIILKVVEFRLDNLYIYILKLVGYLISVLFIVNFSFGELFGVIDFVVDVRFFNDIFVYWIGLVGFESVDIIILKFVLVFLKSCM